MLSVISVADTHHSQVLEIRQLQILHGAAQQGK